jgi:hypothetical protein
MNMVEKIGIASMLLWLGVGGEHQSLRVFMGFLIFAGGLIFDKEK